MTILEILVLLVVAAVCGAIGQAISGYSRGGCLMAIVLGFIGALIGSWLAGAMHLPELLMLDLGGVRFPVVWSIVGATLFVGVIGILSRRSV